MNAAITAAALLLTAALTFELTYRLQDRLMAKHDKWIKEYDGDEI